MLKLETDTAPRLSLVNCYEYSIRTLSGAGNYGVGVAAPHPGYMSSTQTIRWSVAQLTNTRTLQYEAGIT